MTTLDNATVASAPVLRRLYFVRVGFAVVWAVLLGVTASDLGVAARVLLVIYPLFDVAAAVVDFRSSRARELILNIVISSLAAAGLALAATSGIPAVLRVFGGWAIVSGVVQLIVAVRRRKLGGQAAMIISGGLSTVVGATFIVMASGDNAMLTGVAGYAVGGAVFFLISAIRLGRAARAAKGN